MGILAKSDIQEFALPEAGLHKAVCADVHDLDFEETQWGVKHKILIVWEIDEEHPEFGGPFRINKKYTLSLHERSTLSQDLESWRGKAFSEAERKSGFDVEKLIGVPCMVNIIHNETERGTYANIKAVFPMQKGEEALTVSDGYVRIKDRPEDEQKGPKTNGLKAEQAAEKQPVPSTEPVEDGFPF